jgi:glycosyltransferase involved in cell wall biosynthesis
MTWQVCADRTPECLAKAVIQADQNRSEVIERQKSWITANAMPGDVTTELERVYARYAAPRMPARARLNDHGMSTPRFGVVFIGTGIFPYRICGDKNFLLDLSDELNKREIETRFVSIVNGPRGLPQDTRFTFINRAFHSATERHVRRSADGTIIAYRHHHGLPRTWLEIAATLLFHRKTIAHTLAEFENVVVHWMDSSLMVPVLKAACGPSARYVSTMFRYRAAGGPTQQVRVQALRSADRIITGTQASRELLLADGCDSQSIVVAPWGCHSRELTDNEREPTRNLRILWSGFIQQIGRADFLRTIAIARRIREARSDIDFVFSLKPECYSAEFARFNSTGIEVTIGSPSFASELPQYDAFLSPVADSQSSSAPPLTWTEAMSAGLPIITTEHPGALEVLGGGNCGIVAGDYQSLEKTLLDPELATRLAGMRSSAQQRHRTHYDVEAIGARYASVYENLFAQPR